jgi:hypothetical protein
VLKNKKAVAEKGKQAAIRAAVERVKAKQVKSEASSNE